MYSRVGRRSLPRSEGAVHRPLLCRHWRRFPAPNHHAHGVTAAHSGAGSIADGRADSGANGCAGSGADGRAVSGADGRADSGADGRADSGTDARADTRADYGIADSCADAKPDAYANRSGAALVFCFAPREVAASRDVAQ